MRKENQTHNQIEKDLEAFYQAPKPSERFLKSLEADLKAATQEAEKESPMRNFISQVRAAFQVRWVQAPAAIILILTVFIAAVGPKNVIAQVQAWLNYVPGYGFVDLTATRLLTEPVSITKGDMTVTVKQVLSNEEGTFVTLSVDGGPDPVAYLEALGPVTNANYDEWIVAYTDLYENSARLVLPDGTVMDDYYFQGAYWDGFLSFESLPTNVLELSLEMPRIPGLPEGEGPENWQFDLSLVYVEEELAESLPQQVSVDAVSNDVQGVVLRVLDATYSLSEVALRVKIEGIPAGWTSDHYTLDAYLSDDLGNEYPVLYQPQTGLGEDGSYVVTFRPVDPEAKALTLNVVNLAFRVPLEGQAIEVDLGVAPQIGDQFKLDAGIEALGIPVHISGLRIHDEKVEAMPEDWNDAITFELAIDPIPVQDKIAIMGFEVGSNLIENLGRQVISSSGGGVDREMPGFTQTSLSFSLPGETPLPAGNLEISFSAASIYLEGPFTASWEIGN